MLNINQSKVIDLTDSPSQLSRMTEATNLIKGKMNSNSSAPRPPAFKSHAGPRKLVVKNLRQSPKTSPEAYYEHTWKLLDAALTAIFNGQRVSTSLEELYRGVENLCRGDKAAPTYKKLRARCDDYVGGKLKDGLNERAGRSDDEVVVAVDAAWKSWCEQLVCYYCRIVLEKRTTKLF